MRKVLSVLFLTISLLSFSQDGKVCHKIAHIDVEYIMSEWVKVRAIDSTIYSERNQKESEFRPTYNQYLQLEQELAAGKYEGLILENKQLQYEQLRSRVEKFSSSLRTLLLNMQQEMMAPLLSELKATINLVADEGQYDYVISTTTEEGSVVLFCRNQGDEITMEVLRRLSR